MRSVDAYRWTRPSVGAMVAGSLLFLSGCSVDVNVGSEGNPQGQGECQINADCAAKGPSFICRKDTHQCVDLQKTGLCGPDRSNLVNSKIKGSFYGEYKDDKAFLIGSILPSTGGAANADADGAPVEAALKMAVEEINKAGGIPLPSGNVPLGLIACTDEGMPSTDPDKQTKNAVAAAKHLVDVGVPMIVGHTYSGVSTAIANEVTIPSGTLLFSPAATSDALTTFFDKNLVWRTSPPDRLQAEAMKLYVNKVLEPRIQKASPGTPTKVLIINSTDTYGSLLADGLTMGSTPLTINGKPITDVANKSYFVRHQYEAEDVDTTEVLKTVQSFQPNVVLLLGYWSWIENVAIPIETQWAKGLDSLKRPYYVFPDAGYANVLWNRINDSTSFKGNAALAESMRQRVSGTQPGADNPRFQAFSKSYSALYPSVPGSADTLGAAGAYDIAYLMAYARFVLGNQAVTGASLQEAMAKLVPAAGAVPVDSGRNDLVTGFTGLKNGKNIDFNGASGPLDFDLKTGEASSDIQIWCVPPGTGKIADVGVRSSVVYDVSTNPGQPTLTIHGAQGVKPATSTQLISAMDKVCGYGN